MITRESEVAERNDSGETSAGLLDDEVTGNYHASSSHEAELSNF
jgi:hypothetical protein